MRLRASSSAPTVASPDAGGTAGCGVGATTVACQLGFALQAMGKRTAIMDLNLPLGDVAYRVNLFAAICAALTLAVLARIVQRETGSMAAALIAAGATFAARASQQR